MIHSKEAAALLLAFASTLSMADDESREVREIKMADDAVFWALVTSASEEGRDACSRNALACSDDRAELGLTVLAGKESPKSLKAFTSMVRYTLDAGLSEDFTCYALDKGRSMSRQLVDIKPSDLRADCEQRFKNAEAASPRLLRGVDVNSICSTEARIRQKISALADALNRGETCALGDF
jgi:hypothetical protein